jgi:16S rRNA G966 N2-methylase RsmD
LFIENNISTDISSLLFKNHYFKDLSIQEIIEQIEAKKRCERKLKTWYNCNNIYYPNKLNIEQTSSEITAKYKTRIVNGNSIIDLSGGFGVDCFYFSKTIKNVTHCEINKKLSKIAEHNFKQLGAHNVTTIANDGIEYLNNSSNKFDCVYIDPSRRDDHKGKVFLLSDCKPNIIKHLDEIFTKTSKILIKTSPLLDITNIINELNFVKEIHIIAVKNEVKELLILLEKNYIDLVSVKTNNIINKKEDTFSFCIENRKRDATYSFPKKYLYEPNAAILKSGGFNHISTLFKINKLHQHSHLYTSDIIIEFPGRIFNIIETLPYNKKDLRKRFKNRKINVSTRNFPKKVDLLRNELKLLNGGELYLIFTTNINNKKIAILCEKIINVNS